MRTSAAIGGALGSIDGYLEDELDLPTEVDGQLTPLGHLLADLAASAKGLHLTGTLLELASRSPGQYEFKVLLRAIAEHEYFFEYFAATLAQEALYRAEAGANRFADVAAILPAAVPPERSINFLADAVICYLLELDTQCIIMCRAVVEVLAESLSPKDEGTILGRLIGQLQDTKRISTSQAKDMRAINRQAREVLHLEPARHPPSAHDCLRRVSSLLAQLHPQ